ncbi:hypothetical protein Taro_007214 [Colocasia esculenta]|uniref:Pentatricopeptide repeat-containing protein n=1 Tax=Colocasia esculenta TaxID=4460 RepID=A0A843TTI5_COLES|nr:hypothetical protein [Colocasia esculenta]
MARAVSTHVIRITSSLSKSFQSAALSSANPVPHPVPQSPRNLFTEFPPFFPRQCSEDTYGWNLAIRGLLEGKNPKAAFLEYALMRRKGVPADSHTVGFAVKVCCFMMSVWEGPQVHCHVIRMGFNSELVVQTALLNMYSLFEDLHLARRVFDETYRRDLPMWNAILTAYAQKGCPEEAIRIVSEMGYQGIRPNEVSGMSILAACSSLKDLMSGKVVHGYMIKNVLGFDTLLFSALINMYAKCGCLQSARCLFDMMHHRDVVSWTTMINGYSDNDSPQEALALFEEMVAAKIRPDDVTMLGVVSMCGKLDRIELVELVDKYIQDEGFRESIRITNALILVHAKGGNVRRACQIFDQMNVRTIVSWTTMIQGLAIHGHGVEALVRFTQMQRAGYRPDEICFLSVLSACNHSGLVEEARQCFRSMTGEHKIAPWVEHYGCMVDLLCRTGLLDEAFELFVNMPIKPDFRMWRALIGACTVEGNIDLAIRVMDLSGS